MPPEELIWNERALNDLARRVMPSPLPLGRLGWPRNRVVVDAYTRWPNSRSN
jgi:hypothetical protein